MLKISFRYGLKLLFTFIAIVIFTSSFTQAQNNYIAFQENQIFSNEGTKPQLILNDNGTENIELEYTFTGATTTFRKVNNTEYCFFHIEGFNKMGKPGQPALPMHNDLIAIPENADAEIVVVGTQFIEYPGYMIHPALKPALDTEGAPSPVFEIDKKIYNKNKFFPSDVTEIVEIQKIRGMSVAVVQIRPMQFNPVTQKIRVYSKIKYRIEFKGTNKTFDNIGTYNSEHFTNLYSRTLLNSKNIPKGIKGYNPNDPSKNYIIITHDNYLDAADSLANWKRQIGYGVEVISRSSWTENEIFMDIAQRYYSWIPRPDYFVIIGDQQDVPAIMINNYPTDLYYACMDGSADYSPDMAHGRISVSSPVEAMDVIVKIINYERSPVSDPDFFSTALVCAQFQDNDTNGYADRRFTHTAENIRDYLLTQSYDVNRIYYTDYDAHPTNFNDGYYSNGEPIPPELLKPAFKWDGGPQAIINSIDSGKFVVLHRDHGYVGGTGWAHPYFTKPYIDDLGNGNKTPVVFSINCHTGEFSLPECFAEKLLRKTPGGAVGVFAASYSSYSGFNDALTAGFFDAIWSDPGLIPEFGSGGVPNPNVSQHPPILAMGDVLNHGLLRMVQCWDGSGNGNRYQYELFHYFGDPAMKIYTETPVAIVADHPDTISVGSSFISISNSNCPDAVVTAVYKGQLIGKIQLINGSGTIFFLPVIDTLYNLKLTLSKHNYIPYATEIVISPSVVPANDEPCDALLLAVNLVCDPLIFSNKSATNSTFVPAPPCSIYDGYDIWFSAVVPNGGALIIETDTVVGGVTDGAMAVYSGNCSNLTILACDDNSGNAYMPLINIDSLNPGDTIFIRFWNDSTSSVGEFSICVYEPGIDQFASLPYYTGFENGLDQYWDTMSSNSYGRIRIDTAYGPHSGNYHLLMDVSVSDNFCLNAALLRLNLSGEKNVQLRFWFKKFLDENHYEDGIFFSNDGGANFEKIYTLEGGYPEWTQILLNLDELTAEAGLAFSETSVIKFQQYDNWAIDSDGFAFDDINLFSFDTSFCYATLPYETGFENGMDSCWFTSTSSHDGRIRISPDFSPHSGINALAMDVVTNGNLCINQSRLHLDLSTQNNVVMTYWVKEFGDEDHPEDGIYFSDDRGMTYTKVLNLYGNYKDWTKTYLSVSDIAVKYGLDLNNKFLINFVQYDNWGLTSDGFVFDDILINTDSLTAFVEVQPDSLFFSTDTSTIQTHDVQVKNTGIDTAWIHLAQLPGAYSAVPSSFELASGDSITVSISFAPTQLKNYNGLTLFFSNTIHSIDTVVITGKGTQQPKIVPDKKTIDFGLVPITTSVYETFELGNVGSGPLNVVDIDPPLDFHVIGDTAFQMLAFTSRSITIKFSPKTPGPYEDTLFIYSDVNNTFVKLKGLALDVFSIPDDSDEDIIRIYPNPASGILNIQFSENSKLCTGIHIYNMMGEMVRSYDQSIVNSERVSLDISDLTSGIYFLELEVSNNIVVQRFSIIK